MSEFPVMSIQPFSEATSISIDSKVGWIKEFYAFRCEKQSVSLKLSACAKFSASSTVSLRFPVCMLRYISRLLQRCFLIQPFLNNYTSIYVSIIAQYGRVSISNQSVPQPPFHMEFCLPTTPGNFLWAGEVVRDGLNPSRWTRQVDILPGTAFILVDCANLCRVNSKREIP